ncbi:class I SAM-dependent RNA methyltransferase [Desulfuromonas sp. AOP6]|uniref:THUMP domain-containing class I SAM-dependent RNA methyltransferase n=1 Tax=Desulfuromonas sp. AOP6 TaxID=1566351 RepID=UPI00126C3477|nr:class I SAM-dependent RNA methyltransferase [Desulfuromonas sp. AOP6]BCA80569.1 RNA methyltransferase [Desulfuromonas sp. AOP6]
MKRLEGQLFAVTAPGLEVVCAAELQHLGMAGVAAVPGGVEFTGTLADIYRANLWLRTASRVVIRLGAFRSRDFPDLYKKALRLPWGRFIRAETSVRVKTASHRSRLVHGGRIAETVAAAIDRSLGRQLEAGQGEEQLVLVRFDDDHCQISMDTSGELLHRRGYREESAQAPLRETLAAGILALLGWDGGTPLVDPMCGSGTFVIEGALLAANLPPGGGRHFAFMNWPGFRPGLWEALKLEAARARREIEVSICGSDRNPVALAAARRNAERAGVADLVRLEVADLAESRASAVAGTILCNPPYGERLGKGENLAPLYRQLGHVYAQSFCGWRRAIFCPASPLVDAVGLPLKKIADLVNGGLSVGLFVTDGECK